MSSSFIGISGQKFISSVREIQRGNRFTTRVVQAFSYGLNIDYILNYNKQSKQKDELQNNFIIRLTAGSSDASFEKKYSENFTGNIFFINLGIGLQSWSVVKKI